METNSSDSFIYKYLKKIDFIGPEFNFENDDSKTYRSIEGVVFSIITLIAIVTISFLFGQELYQRKNPIVAGSKSFNITSDFDLDDYPVIFTFHNSLGQEVPNIEQYLDFHAVYHKLDNNSIPNNTLLPILPCKSINTTYKNDIVNSFINGPLKTYCLRNSPEMKIDNIVGSPNSKFLRYRFLFCDEKNDKRSTKCFLDPKVLGLSLVISISYLDTYIDSTNFKNPIKFFLTKFIQPLSPGLFKIITFTVNKDTYISDDGWLIEQFRRIDYLNLLNYRLDVSLSSTTSDNVAMNLLLESPKLILTTKRSYFKVQEFLARIGGIANAFYILMTILSYDYLRFKYLFFLRDESFGKMDANIKTMNMAALAKKLSKKRESNTFLENFAKLNFDLIEQINNISLRSYDSEHINEDRNNIKINDENKEKSLNNFLKEESFSVPDCNIPFKSSNNNESKNYELQMSSTSKQGINNVKSSNNKINELDVLSISSKNSENKSSFLPNNNSRKKEDIFINMQRKDIKFKTEKIDLNEQNLKKHSPIPSKLISQTTNLKKDKLNKLKRVFTKKIIDMMEEKKEYQDKENKFNKETELHLNDINQKKRRLSNNKLIEFTDKTKEIKEEISKTLFGYQEFDSSENPNYLKYRSNYVFCCCKSDKLINIYEFELNRVRKLLDVKVFNHFLIESYAKHYYVSDEREKRMI